MATLVARIDLIAAASLHFETADAEFNIDHKRDLEGEKMNLTKAAHGILAAGLMLAVAATNPLAAKKPGGGQGKCQSIAATWEFADRDGDGLQSDGSAYDATIQTCSGSTDATLNTGRKRAVFITLGTGAPGWADGYHSVFANIRKLLFNPASTENPYAFTSLQGLPNQEYSFTTVMVVRPDSYDDYPIWFFNSTADTYGLTNQNGPANGALVNVTYSPLGAGQHEWVIEPATPPVAEQTYELRQDNTVTEESAGLYEVPFRITITASE